MHPPGAHALAALLDDLRACRFPAEGDPAPPRDSVVPSAEGLGGFLDAVRAPLAEVRAIGNPWVVAGLRDDELRNSAVLAWFLDPRGTHGLGDGVLRAVLAHAARTVALPPHPSPGCRVAVEDCPDGELHSRVDITIDDPGRFFLGIEVKIKAGEQPRQVERYARLARERACDGRPWAVVFLTPGGRPATTAGEFAPVVVPLAWKDIAAALRRLAAAGRRDGRSAVSLHLATTFASHVSGFR